MTTAAVGSGGAGALKPNCTASTKLSSTSHTSPYAQDKIIQSIVFVWAPPHENYALLSKYYRGVEGARVYTDLSLKTILKLPTGFHMHDLVHLRRDLLYFLKQLYPEAFTAFNTAAKVNVIGENAIVQTKRMIQILLEQGRVPSPLQPYDDENYAYLHLNAPQEVVFTLSHPQNKCLNNRWTKGFAALVPSALTGSGALLWITGSAGSGGLLVGLGLTSGVVVAGFYFYRWKVKQRDERANAKLKQVLSPAPLLAVQPKTPLLSAHVQRPFLSRTIQLPTLMLAVDGLLRAKTVQVLPAFPGGYDSSATLSHFQNLYKVAGDL
jgi:hypothetical protein